MAKVRIQIPEVHIDMELKDTTVEQAKGYLKKYFETLDVEDPKQCTVTEVEEVSHWCIFEKRNCRHAEKIGPVFNCKAPSDAEMTCRR